VFCSAVASHLPWILHICRQQHMSLNLCVKKRDCCTRRCDLTFYCGRKNIHTLFPPQASRDFTGRTDQTRRTLGLGRVARLSAGPTKWHHSIISAEWKHGRSN
jgi:hypothetical protein